MLTLMHRFVLGSFEFSPQPGVEPLVHHVPRSLCWGRREGTVPVHVVVLGPPDILSKMGALHHMWPLNLNFN